VRCGDPAVIVDQHNPQCLDDGAVLVADSDNDRVVELHRTEEGRWEPRWAVSDAGGLGFSWPRDADRLPSGNTLVTDSMNERVLVVNESGGLVWSRSTDHIPYEADHLGANASAPLPTYEDGGADAVDADSGGDVPVLSTITFILHTAVPALPFWVGELQVGVTLVALVLVVGAGVQWYREKDPTG
jgi:hypothetical protein